MIEIEIDHDVCYGAQNCARVAPGAFLHDDDGKALPGDPTAVSPAQLRMAEDQCPAMAIAIKGLAES
jgi:ferredoxin